ncbi:hypothetical protein PF001_g24376 [Phytophthora fragariae]|uniref:Nudix hydrolase domain-containing protein n=2 Tax=Phytophthora fragariae TaxID=53985 RepID=A0A6A4BVN7_9STRA|nr:hypothetical protein PF001_g24376 [Phytophthora fragariae]
MAALQATERHDGPTSSRNELKVRGLALLAPAGCRPHKVLRPKESAMVVNLMRTGNPVVTALIPLFIKMIYTKLLGFPSDALPGHSLHRSLKLPSLVAWSQNDEFMEEEIPRELARLCHPGPRLAFAGGGHNVQKTRAEQVAGALTRAMDRSANSVQVAMSAPWKRRRQRNAYDRSWGILVLDREDKMLLLQHRSGHHWSFCKGHKKDTDTSDIHTAARELFEETELRVPKLWTEQESWEEYCNATDEFFNEHTVIEEEEVYIRRITPQGPARPRMFREEYSFYKRNNRKVDKRVEFYVARIQDPAALQIQTEEIIASCWLSLDQVADHLKYPEDRKLFLCVKQAISM